MCPKCGLPVAAEMNFCPNCGKRLKEKPASTGWLAVLWLMIVSVLLPPFGVGLTVRYLRSSDKVAKMWGVISLVLTIGVLAVAVWGTIVVSRNLNQVINQQLNTYMNIGN